MKIGIKNNESINSTVVFLGLLIIIILIIISCFGFPERAFGGFVTALFVCGVIFIEAIIKNIQNLLNYIVIDEEVVTFYRRKKPLKRINLGEIQSFVLGQYMGRVRGRHIQDKYMNGNIYIIINDGTFFNKKWTKREFRKNILRNSEGWIAIEYSAKRYAALKKLLPNCEVETYTLTKKKK